MKKLLITAAIVPLFGTVASAGPDEDWLQLNGKVDYNCEMGLGQTSSSVSVGPNTGAHQIGSFTVTCNAVDGFKLRIHSPDGKFELAGGGYALPFELAIAGTHFTPGTASTAAEYSEDHAGFNAAFTSGASATITFTPDTAVAATMPGNVSMSDNVVFSVEGL